MPLSAPLARPGGIPQHLPVGSRAVRYARAVAPSLHHGYPWAQCNALALAYATPCIPCSLSIRLICSGGALAELAGVCVGAAPSTVLVTDAVSGAERMRRAPS